MYKSNAKQRRKFMLEHLAAQAKYEKAINEKRDVVIDPITTPVEVILSQSEEKRTSWVKDQFFPDELIDRALEGFAKHGKRVAITCGDTAYKAHSPVLGNVLTDALCRNLTGEDDNDNHHQHMVIGNLAADSKVYEGVIQRLVEVGAIDLGMIKALRDGYGHGNELDDYLFDSLSPEEGYDLTIRSNSWGGLNASSGMRSFIEAAKSRGGSVVHLFAAGNSGVKDGPFDVDRVTYPGAFAYSLTAGSLNEDGTRSYFSSDGEGVDFSVGGHSTLSVNRDGNPVLWNGTSSSTPYLAALSAILFLINPEKYNTQKSILKGLQECCFDIKELPALPGWDRFTGWGAPKLNELFPDKATPPEKETGEEREGRTGREPRPIEINAKISIDKGEAFNLISKGEVNAKLTGTLIEK